MKQEHEQSPNDEIHYPLITSQFLRPSVNLWPYKCYTTTDRTSGRPASQSEQKSVCEINTVKLPHDLHKVNYTVPRSNNADKQSKRHPNTQ